MASIETALAAGSAWLGGASAVRRLQLGAGDPLGRADYELEVWAADADAEARRIAVAVYQGWAKGLPAGKDVLHLRYRGGDWFLQFGSHRLCRVRRAPRFRMQSVTTIAAPDRARGRFARTADIPCMPAAGLLYQLYSELAAAEPPGGESYVELLAREAMLFARLSASRARGGGASDGGAAASGASNAADALMVVLDALASPSVAGGAAAPARPAREPWGGLLTGGSRGRRPDRGPRDARGDPTTAAVAAALAAVRAAKLPLLQERPILLVVAERVGEAVALLRAAITDKCGAKVDVKRNLLLLPGDDVAAKRTLYLEARGRRLPVAEVYESAQHSPVGATAGWAAPFARLQHLAAEMWIAEVLHRADAIPAAVAAARLRASRAAMGDIRAGLAADPRTGVRGVTWYGGSAPAEKQARRFFVAKTVLFADDLAASAKK
jgi:hypothetical protein